MKFHLSFLWVVFLVLSFYSNVLKIYLMIFLLLFIHEMGHVFVAKIMGYKIRDIHIYPFGFSANIDHFNHIKPLETILILIGGIGFHFIFPYFFMFLYECKWISYVYYQYLMGINDSIVLFNLLPIFPLDGGRFLLAFLRFFFNYTTSKRLTLCISIIFTMILLMISVTSMKIILVFLAYLLYIEICKEDEDYVEYQYYKIKSFKVDKNHV